MGSKLVEFDRLKVFIRIWSSRTLFETQVQELALLVSIKPGQEDSTEELQEALELQPSALISKKTNQPQYSNSAAQSASSQHWSDSALNPNSIKSHTSAHWSSQSPPLPTSKTDSFATTAPSDQSPSIPSPSSSQSFHSNPAPLLSSQK